MALFSIGMDFGRPLRLVVLVGVFVFALFFLQPVIEERYSWSWPVEWATGDGYRPDILQYINPLIGTINGGERFPFFRLSPFLEGGEG